MSFDSSRSTSEYATYKGALRNFPILPSTVRI